MKKIMCKLYIIELINKKLIKTLIESFQYNLECVKRKME